LRRSYQDLEALRELCLTRDLRQVAQAPDIAGQDDVAAGQREGAAVGIGGRMVGRPDRLVQRGERIGVLLCGELAAVRVGGHCSS